MNTRAWPAAPLGATRQRLRTAWAIVHLGALLLALALSPSTYRRPWRTPLAVQVVRAAWPLLPWFTLLSALLALVVVRIVLVTAQSYGLSALALEMLVRVLVLELIPLGAALAVALRVTLPLAAELAAARRRGALGADALRREIAPRALAGVFCVLLVAALGALVALVLTYLLAYGFTPWALPRYTRLVGQVFAPVVALVFVLKTLALAVAVSLMPIGSALHGHDAHDGVGLEVQGLVRMFVVVLAVEVAALAGNYL